MFETNNLNNIDISVESAFDTYLNAISEENLEYENINVEDSLSRILYDDITVKRDYPSFDKALEDGYAVNSSDVLSARQNNPIKLEIIGETNVENLERLTILTKQAVKISKGAFLPENADAIILPADAKEKDGLLNVFKSVTPDSWIAKKGEDIKADEVFIKKNRKIRPQDIGGIIGIGFRQVKVYKKPVVTIIPTGNELVPLDVDPDSNQIIASNGYVLKGFVEQFGGIGRISSIVKDDLNQVKSAISKALEVSDMILVSGGSSAGSKDYTFQAIKSLKNSVIIAHGIAMRPGNHVLLALVDNKPVIGLPGHPVSNLTSFHIFGKAVLRKLAGSARSFWQERKDNIKLDALLAKKICSPLGKEDYVRVRLFEQEDGKITAYPYTGKSSFLSTLVKSHGIVKIPSECGCLYEGDRVEVLLF
ncbi:MAG TPA: molybdopterin molybdotransferase MoeA [Candidatus Gastranaerophilales bacterium]|nr:molybdopterin molybdotransferase MoeA [Candidatus Gastranaerophilales bacterium]